MALTLKRVLRSGTPVWLAKGLPRIRVAKTLSDRTYDVVIVGTGISGALVSDAMLNAGFSVLAVDRRKSMSGSTPASTALLQSEIDTPLIELRRKLGKTDAARAWLRSAQAVQALRDRIEDLKIMCDFLPRSTLYLPGNVLNVDGLKQETAARRKLGLRSTFIAREELLAMSGFRKAGAISTEGNAEVDPAKLVAGIWRSFLDRGGQLMANVEITDVEQSKSQVRLHSAGGLSIDAKHVVFCTGYELMKFTQPKGYKIISTWVLATKPQPRHLWKGQSLIWEASDPYLYLRTTRDGRIIAGGEDETFSGEAKRDALLPEKIAAIARKAKKLLPLADFEADFFLDGLFWRKPDSASSRRTRSRSLAMLFGARVWRQWHYIQHARSAVGFTAHSRDQRP